MGSSLSYEGRPVLHTFRLSALVRKWKEGEGDGFRTLLAPPAAPCTPPIDRRILL
jgi:hypothetical protein